MCQMQWALSINFSQIPHKESIKLPSLCPKSMQCIYAIRAYVLCIANVIKYVNTINKDMAEQKPNARCSLKWAIC